ncbi:MAG TPA: hypothetical protein VGM84_18140 [Steroidobacteraceae bacterium]|jgi:hypothetical protein
MYDDRTDNPSFSEAGRLISNADHVCFLGFGFDADNIEACNLNRLCAGKSTWATRFNMPDGEWQRAQGLDESSGTDEHGQSPDSS